MGVGPFYDWLDGKPFTLEGKNRRQSADEVNEMGQQCKEKVLAGEEGWSSAEDNSKDAKKESKTKNDFASDAAGFHRLPSPVLTTGLLGAGTILKGLTLAAKAKNTLDIGNTWSPI